MFRSIRPISDMPLKFKGLIVVAIPLAGLIAAVLAFYLVQNENKRAEQWVTHTLEVRNEIQMVHTRLDEAETGMLGYVITRNPAWLGRFRGAQQQLPKILDRLDAMVADNPGQHARVRRIRGLVIDRLKALESTPARVPPEAAGSHPALADNRIALDQIHTELDQMRATEDQLLADRRSHARAVWSKNYAVTAAGALFVPVAAIIAMLLFARAVTRRVRVLDENAGRLARGVAIAPMRSGNDEIGRLEQSLGAAATLLAQREEALRRSADELELRVRERTEELADANQRLKAVIDASPLAIFRMDLDGTVKSWNRAAEQMFGWKEDEVLDRPLPTIPDEAQHDFHDLLSGASRGEVLTGLETRRRRKDGKIIDIRLWTAPVRHPSGEIRGKIAIAADFTDHKRLEEQFSHAQRMEAIGRLAGGVAHDFNNVITVVSGYGHMLHDAVRHDSALRDSAEEILKAADRATALAQQLLAFSRKQVIQPKIIDLNALVRDVQRMLARVIGEDVELKTLLREDVGTVRADAGQIEQVLMNLAVNARDAMPSGGKLTIETANLYLDEGYARTHAGVAPGPYVMLAVSDTGTGMDPETKPHVFEPFFTTKERGKGTGLGLSTVYGIVKQHGGDIWVYSEPGRGTTFKIYLPHAAAAQAAALPMEHQAPPAHGHETVLVVEDEDGVRKLIRDILEQRGYRVLEAESGEKALDIAGKNGDLDLLLTDVVMPKMSGRDLAEALVLLFPQVRVLFLSGYTDQVVVEHGVLHPEAEFLQKPFTPDVLSRKVRQVLDKDRTTAKGKG